MLRLCTVILRHTTPTDTHHDWLIVDPAGLADPAARLWTARVGPPPRAWSACRGFTLTPLPPHRRVYLQYQGPIGGGRGHVRRVDRGEVIPRLWTTSRLVLDLRLSACQGRCEARRLTDDRWLARFVPERGGVVGKTLGVERPGA